MEIVTGTATDPWKIFAYEVRMFFGCCDVLSDPTAQSRDDLINNSTVESACLHARILIDILLSKDSGKGDDIKLNQLLPGFKSPTIDKLLSVYGTAQTRGSPCWILNKKIAHPTLERGISYDYTGVLRQLHPLIVAVLHEVQSHQVVSTKLPQPSSIDPRFCAKTSS